MGSSPGTLYYTHPFVRQLYCAFVWKASNPYQYNQGSNNKLVYLAWNQGASSFIAFEMYGSGTPAEFAIIPVRWPVDQVYRAGTGAGTTKTPIVLGTWYRIEIYVKYATTGSSGDGIVKWWASSWNGSGWNAPVLQGNLTTIQSPNNSGFDFFEVYPGFGGSGVNKAQLDFMWYDHVHLSRP